MVAGQLGPGPPWQLGRGHLIAGLVVMWAGLAVRIWAILVLGRAFRTTVEVDPGQAVVDCGPYRWVRHPSYAGTLVISAGVGLTLGNWLSLAIMLLLPLAAMLRRISVEETALTEVLGQPYQALPGAGQTPRARTLVTIQARITPATTAMAPRSS